MHDPDSMASTSAHPVSASTGAHRIQTAFVRAREAGRSCAVMPFVTAGYPDLGATVRVLEGAAAAGADLVELGIPFSDPIADGPVIAESMHEALVAGVSPSAIFDAIAACRCEVPVVAMVSVSIVERMGVEAFCRRATDAGVAGFIVPDADPAAARELAAHAGSIGAGWCPLIAPTSSDERRREVAASATGFVYLLARVGITGERSDAPEVSGAVMRLRSETRAPIAVGFGISRPEHVAAVGAQADGAIVGSAIVRVMREAKDRGEDSAEAALALVRALASGATGRK
ncbi:MAG: tryptophan synthase alpha chain [Planctomycetota bacterium]